MSGITQEGISRLFDDHKIYHSAYQMDNFITGKNGVTLYGMYKQALRELYSRWEALKIETVDIRILRLDIKTLEKRVASKPNTERSEIEILKKCLDLDSRERQIKHRIREFCRFFNQAAFLKDKFGDLSEEDHYRLDHEMWIAKIRRNIVVDMLSAGRVSNATTDTILGLPPEDKKKLLADMAQPESLIKAAQEADSSLPEFPVTAAEIEEVRRQLEC